MEILAWKIKTNYIDEKRLKAREGCVEFSKPDLLILFAKANLCR